VYIIWITWLDLLAHLHINSNSRDLIANSKDISRPVILTNNSSIIIVECLVSQHINRPDNPIHNAFLHPEEDLCVHHLMVVQWCLEAHLTKHKALTDV
jgi:hypothetical protein